jgi:hypothetical protein
MSSMSHASRLYKVEKEQSGINGFNGELMVFIFLLYPWMAWIVDGELNLFTHSEFNHGGVLPVWKDISLA